MGSESGYNHLSVVVIIHIKHIIPESVDDPGMLEKGGALGCILKMGMNMSVDEIRRCIFINQPPKTLKTSVTSIFRIVNMSRWRMGNNNIDTFAPPEAWAQPLYLPVHLVLGILIGAAVVPAGAFQPQDAFSFKFDQFMGQVGAPPG